MFKHYKHFFAFLWLASFCCPSSVSAQVFSSNFNSNATGWSFSTQQGGNDWKWYADQGVDATGGLRNKNVSTSNWAISPAINLEAGTQYRVSFKGRAATANTRTITVAYNTTASRTGATQIGTSGNNPVTNFANY